MESKADLVVFVYTGNRQHSGTNNKVQIILHSDEGKSSKPVALNKFFSNDLETGTIDKFHVDSDRLEGLDGLVRIRRLEIWKSSFLGIFYDDWFLEKIVVDNTSTHASFVFPFFRWISSGRRYNIELFDTSLPRRDPHTWQRERELAQRRKVYRFCQKIPHGPAQVKSVPRDEQFSLSYKLAISTTKLRMTALGTFQSILTDEFHMIEDIQHTYRNNRFQVPRYMHSWHLDSNFGRQRLSGVNPSMLKLLRQLPDKFPVTDDLLGDLLDGLTIREAIQQNKLFITDHYLMEGIPTRKGFVICKPIGLFFVDGKKRFLPVAIQLFQDPREDNPIFTPHDDHVTWNLVKMWYNNADAAYHQSLVHLGFTHLMMEGFCVATHRNLSPSHPIYKLLSPHFLYLLGINQAGLSILLSPDGWIDSSMNVGAKGVEYLVGNGFDEWRMDVNGCLPEDLKQRGVDNTDLLPDYHYRDDGMLLYNCIKNYVTEYVQLYYVREDDLIEDREIQAWGRELVQERETNGGGCGYQGIPGNGKLTESEDLIAILTCIIFTCSVTHAAVNFPQYDEYGFPPNFPACMTGTPPTRKDAVMTEKDMVTCLPGQDLTLGIITMTTVLSKRGTNRLGDFEVQTIFDPPALEIVTRFRESLEIISSKIKERSAGVEQPYDYLDPERIPNAISI